MPYTVVFAPEAEAQLVALYGHIAAKASPEIAEHYTNAVVTYCEAMQTFPIAAHVAMTCDPACASRITNGEPLSRSR